jgi:hypothetical protein
MFNLEYVPTFVVVLGCASAPHTTPDEMSAADHQAEAAREAAQARELAQEEPLVGRDDGPTPMSEQEAEAAYHWRAAAAHGAAAKELIAAEDAACARSLPPERQNPFVPSARVASVTPLRGRSKDAPAGAIIALRKDPALTEEKLLQQVRCQMAHAATLGYDTRQLGESPLALKNTTADVASADDGTLRVRITSSDPATAREILRRCEALASGCCHDSARGRPDNDLAR